MNLRTTHNAVREVADLLPAGATLVVHDFGWEDYEHLLGDLGKRHGLRVSYDSERLQVVSIAPAHERCIVIIENIVTTYCDALNLTLGGYGRATGNAAGAGGHCSPSRASTCGAHCSGCRCPAA